MNVRELLSMGRFAFSRRLNTSKQESHGQLKVTYSAGATRNSGVPLLDDSMDDADDFDDHPGLVMSNCVKPDPPAVLPTLADAKKHMELMHDRCISRNLRAAGLGSCEVFNEEKVYGPLSPNATVSETNLSLLWTVLLHFTDREEQQARFVNILVVENVDVNEKDSSGRTPLMYAVQGTLHKSAKSLMHSKRMDHSVADNNGNIALHYLAKYGNEVLLKCYLKLLKKLEMKLAAGKFSTCRFAANRPFSYIREVFEAKNSDGKTARELAESRHNFAFAGLIDEEHRRRKNKGGRGMGMVHQSLSPGRRLLKRIASFDNLTLKFDSNPIMIDYVDEEDGSPINEQSGKHPHANQGGFNNLDGMRSRLSTWHGKKYSNDSDRANTPDQAIVTSKVLGEGRACRTDYFQSKSEMLREALPSSAPMTRSSTFSSNDQSAFDNQFQQPKRKITDKIRQLLRRKPHYYSRHATGSMENLTAVSPSLTSSQSFYEPNHTLKAQCARRKSSSLSKVEEMAAANKLWLYNKGINTAEDGGGGEQVNTYEPAQGIKVVARSFARSS